AYKFRLYPTPKQATLIHKSMGCSRFVFNQFLVRWNENYTNTGKGLTYHTCSSQLTQLKKEIDWLNEVDSTSLQNSLKNYGCLFTLLQEAK
ncbi:putative transposase, partial [Kroppenstedtia eburnea]